MVAVSELVSVAVVVGCLGGPLCSGDLRAGARLPGAMKMELKLRKNSGLRDSASLFGV